MGDFLEAFSTPIQTTSGYIGNEERLPRKVLAIVLRSLRQTENTREFYHEVNRLPLNGERDFHEETLESSGNVRFLNTGLFGTIDCFFE